MERTLDQIAVRETARVLTMRQSDIGVRLTELGLTPGCRVTCLYAAASGDPRAYRVRGTVLAIRKSDASGIEVEPWD